MTASTPSHRTAQLGVQSGDMPQAAKRACHRSWCRVVEIPLRRPVSQGGRHGRSLRLRSRPPCRELTGAEIAALVQDIYIFFQVIDCSRSGGCLRQLLFMVVSPSSLRFRCCFFKENKGSDAGSKPVRQLVNDPDSQTLLRLKRSFSDCSAELCFCQLPID